MQSRTYISSLLSLVLLVWSCGGSGSSPESRTPVAWESGGLVTLSSIADLRGSPAAPIDNPAVWVPQPVAAGQGWGRAQKGWHPAGERATLAFSNAGGTGSTLEIALLHRNEAPVASHRVEVRLNDRPVGGFHTTAGVAQTRLFPPPGLLKDLNQVELLFDPPIEELPGETQTHLSLIGFGIRREDGPNEPVHGVVSRDLMADGHLRIAQSGVWVTPWKIPRLASRLRLEAKGLAGGSTKLELFALRGSGERVDLLTTELAAGERIRSEAEISGLQGERVTLFLEVALSSREGGIEIRDLSADAGSSSSPEEVSSDQGQAPAALPDVIVIVLDAARGDRFPGWNYPRQVMPNLEELAQSSMSFRHAFSECPTTSCSIPALVTGVPFLPGGEVGRGQKLSDEVVTLAEHLQPLGYRTIGFSATPNNSASRNLHQGFDTFRELWGHGNPDHGPFNMSRLAIEVIERQPQDEPLFLQLHYLPPHQPYAPGPEFDRFTDPDYAGAIRPDMSMGPINEGWVTPSQADLEQLIGLYDGNLLLADFVVGQVFDALRETHRFENSLIVITSDHGEAFMEHGWLTHNTTLFDEMLHVPLMIRLPGGEIPEIVDQGRLASTLDVVPTVLGYLGAAADAPPGGVDLLHTQPDPNDPRMLFLRTSHPRNRMVSARTRKWKQISWPRLQVQMLFDLEEDPGEMDNLVAARPYLYAGMGLRLRQHMIEASQRKLEAAEIELTAEAEEALRALGYLD